MRGRRAIPLLRLLPLLRIPLLRLLALRRIRLLRLAWRRIPLLRVPLLRVPLLRVPLLRIALLRIALLRIALLRVRLLTMAVLRVTLRRLTLAGRLLRIAATAGGSVRIAHRSSAFTGSEALPSLREEMHMGVSSSSSRTSPLAGGAWRSRGARTWVAMTLMGSRAGSAGAWR